MAENFKEQVQTIIERSESELRIIIHNIADVLPKKFAGLNDENANLLVDLNSVRSILETASYMLTNMGVYFEEQGDEFDEGEEKTETCRGW